MNRATTFVKRDRGGEIESVGWICEANCGASEYWKAPDGFEERTGWLNDVPWIVFLQHSTNHVCGDWKPSPQGDQETLFEVNHG